MRKNFPAGVVVAVLGCLISTGASAYLINPNTCTTDSFAITKMETSPLDGNGVVFEAPPNVDSTSCFGVVDGNDHQGGLSAPNPNIGELNDGLLNGEGNIVSPLQFISASQLLDLDGDGTATDPGWLFLGSVDGGGSGIFVMDGYNKPLAIDDILALTLTCTGAGGDACTIGTWTLTTELDIIDVVQALLGRNSFDHLAFVTKSAQGFAIYDFDFNIILQSLLDAGGAGFDYVTPYSFTGIWNTDDFTNQRGNSQNYSHISVWARDPLSTTQVPVPGTLALLGLGLVVFGFVRRRKN